MILLRTNTVAKTCHTNNPDAKIELLKKRQQRIYIYILLAVTQNLINCVIFENLIFELSTLLNYLQLFKSTLVDIQ